MYSVRKSGQTLVQLLLLFAAVLLGTYAPANSEPLVSNFLDKVDVGHLSPVLIVWAP